MYCPTCGKEIPNDATYCPNCGASLEVQEEKTTPVNNVFAIIGYVSGIVTLSLCWCFVGIVPFGIVFSSIGLGSCESKFKHKAKKGLIMSIIGTVISVLWLILFFVIIILAAEAEAMI